MNVYTCKRNYIMIKLLSLVLLSTVLCTPESVHAKKDDKHEKSDKHSAEKQALKDYMKSLPEDQRETFKENFKALSKEDKKQALSEIMGTTNNAPSAQEQTQTYQESDEPKQTGLINSDAAADTVGNLLHLTNSMGRSGGNSASAQMLEEGAKAATEAAADAVNKAADVGMGLLGQLSQGTHAGGAGGQTNALSNLTSGNLLALTGNPLTGGSTNAGAEIGKEVAGEVLSNFTGGGGEGKLLSQAEETVSSLLGGVGGQHGDSGNMLGQATSMLSSLTGGGKHGGKDPISQGEDALNSITGGLFGGADDKDDKHGKHPKKQSTGDKIKDAGKKAVHTLSLGIF